MAPSSLVGLLERTARRHPEGAALVGRRGGVRWCLSWDGLRTRVLLGAAQLQAADVGPGDAVAVWADPGPRRVVASLAVHARGAAEVPMGPWLPDGQASVVLDEADPTAAVVEAHARRRRRALADAGVAPALDPADLPDPARPLAEDARDEAAVAEPDEAALLCPTGWADDTEIVPVTTRELARGVQAAAEALPMGRGDRVLQGAPPTHLPARVAGTLAPVAAGAAVAPVEGLPARVGRDAGADLLASARALGANMVACGGDGAADCWRALGSEAGPPPVERVLAAGDPVPGAARRGLVEAGVDLLEVHGPPETGPVVAVGPRVEGALTPLPGVEARADGGLLRVRGPGTPAAAVEDGWMATGWRGRVTDEARLVPEGRAGDALEVGDEVVAAEDVEAALRGASPAVARSVAFAVEDEVGAVVVPDGAEAGDDGDEKVRERVLEAARRAEPGPDRVMVRAQAPEAEAGLRDHALEVRRGDCARAWADAAGWHQV